MANTQPTGYYFAPPSHWPVVGSVALFFIAIGGVLLIRDDRLFQQAGEAIAVGDERALVHAIRQADEGGELVPGERRPAGAPGGAAGRRMP